MKLKSLILPIIIIIAIISAAGVILPKFIETMDLNKEQKKIEQDLAETEKKLQKAKELSQELLFNTEKQNILLRYIPISEQEEEAINNLNEAASAANIAISSLSLAKNLEKSTGTAAEKDAIEASGKNANSKTISSNALKTIVFEAIAVGSYDQVKLFLEKLDQMQRFAEVSSLEISKAEDADSAGSGRLQASMVLSFGYLDNISVANVDNEILNSGKFNMSVIDKITDKAKNNFYDINIGQTGKINPFLP